MRRVVRADVSLRSDGVSVSTLDVTSISNEVAPTLIESSQSDRNTKHPDSGPGRAGDAVGSDDEGRAARVGGRSPEIVGTILIPLHNHGRFIAKALAAIIAAWQPGFELLLIDDASIDDGFTIAATVLAAHPEIPVTMARTSRALGMGNAQLIAQLARGGFIVQCDSDDVPMPDRLAAIAACFARDSSCRLVTSNAVTLSIEGVPLGLFDTRSQDQVFDDPSFAAGCAYDARWLGATAAYHRELFDAFPLFDAELCPYGLDLLTPLRALLLGTHHYIARPLVGYRLHAGNSHREAGAYMRAPADRERYEALEMMVLAQKLRDLQAHAASRVAAESAGDDLLETARQVFFAKFDRWSRLFTQARASGATQAAAPMAPYIAAVPPIATLRPGETLGIADRRFAAMIGQWSGFYGAEDWGSWLHPCALVVLRLAGPSRTCLRLDLHGNPTVATQHVSIRVGTAPWIEIHVGAYERKLVDVELPPYADEAVLVPLILISHDAAVPNGFDGSNEDERLLGIGLRSIELV